MTRTLGLLLATNVVVLLAWGGSQAFDARQESQRQAKEATKDRAILRDRFFLSPDDAAFVHDLPYRIRKTGAISDADLRRVLAIVNSGGPKDETRWTDPVRQSRTSAATSPLLGVKHITEGQRGLLEAGLPPFPSPGWASRVERGWEGPTLTGMANVMLASRALGSPALERQIRESAARRREAAPAVTR